MGEKDIERQALNVFKMKLLGAEVIPVRTGTRTLKDATNQAIRDWVTNVRDTHYIIGSVVGPHPYPMMVRDFQRVIGDEVKNRSWRKREGWPITCLPVSAGAVMPLGSFTHFLRMKGFK
jgi:Tryptophan synthase beta chain